MVMKSLPIMISRCQKKKKNKEFREWLLTRLIRTALFAWSRKNSGEFYFATSLFFAFRPSGRRIREEKKKKRNEDSVMDGSQMFEFLDTAAGIPPVWPDKNGPPLRQKTQAKCRHTSPRSHFVFRPYFFYLYSERRVHDPLRRRINHGANFHCVTFLVTRVIEAKPICT